MPILITLLLLTATGGRDQAFEDALCARYDAIEYGLGAKFAEATRARDEGRTDEAVRLFEALTHRAPDESAAHRRLALLYADTKRLDEGLALAEKARALEPSAENDVALMFLLSRRSGPGDDARVDRLAADIVAHSQPGDDAWVAARMEQCSKLPGGERLAACAEDVFQRAPEHPFGVWLGVVGAGVRGDTSLARERLDAGRDRLSPEQVGRLEQLLDSSDPFEARWGRRLATVGLGWASLFTLLALLGFVLSALTLRTARRLATERTPHPSSGAKSLRAVYRGVMSLGAVFYYLSLPLVALAVVLLFGGFVYACFAFGRIPIKLVVLAVVVGGLTLVALLRSLFVRASDEDPGLELDLTREPRLKALIDSVAAKVGTRTVDTVFLTPGTELAVFERGSLLRRLRGQGERCLILGRGVLDGFALAGFRSVLAHEFGHFSNEDTAGGDVALVARRSLFRMGLALAESGAASWYNPAWLFFRGWHWVYLRISQGASRLQEVLADRIAIFAYGSPAFALGYRHVVTQSVRFDAHVNRTIKEVVEAQRTLPNLYRFVPAEPAPVADIDSAVREALEREAEPFDSHPSSKDRLGWCATLNIEVPSQATDGDDVLSLFEDLERLEREMTEQIRLNLAVNHDLVIPAPATGDQPQTS